MNLALDFGRPLLHHVQIGYEQHRQRTILTLLTSTSTLLSTTKGMSSIKFVHAYTWLIVVD